MRLLTLPITIVRVPIELGFGAAKEAVKFAHGLVGGGEEPVAEKPRPAPPPRRRRTSSRRSGNGRARTAAKPTPPPATEAPAPAKPATEPVPEPPAAEPPVVEPAPEPTVTQPAPEPTVTEAPSHVSEEPELVAEVAETGAEEGAGAEVVVDEPWPGYDQMTAADIEDRLVTESPETAAAVSLYEASRKGRASILEAASRSMTA
jgi:hypothetical protein